MCKCGNQGAMNDALSADLAEAQEQIKEAREWIDILAAELVIYKQTVDGVRNALAEDAMFDAMRRAAEHRKSFLSQTIEGAIDADSTN